jgi:hypothetical protein
METEESRTTCGANRPVATARYDDTGDSVIEALVRALAEARGVCVTEVAPLYDVVDPDALGRLFQTDDGADSELRLDFRVDNWSVSVSADGRVCVFDTPGFTGR